MTAHQPDFVSRVVAAALVVRLLAIMVALAGMVGETMTAPILVCVLVLSGSSFAFLVYPSVAGTVSRHPLIVVADVLLALGVLAALGVESPLVLATLSTALIIGVQFERRTAVVGAVVLVAGYLLAARIDPSAGRGFMVELGIPALYVCLVAVGSVVRTAHGLQVAAGREVAAAQRAAAAADERARLAREMHDSLGKTLLGISLAAEALPVWVERDPQGAIERARGLADGAKQAAEEARELLVRMRADQPDRPLAEVLAERCAQWAAVHGVSCTFTSLGAVDLSTDARYELLAIVSEALENVARHAAASVVVVRLEGEADGSVSVCIQDDGRGFTTRPDGTSPSGHFGLTGMQERAREAGATIEITSERGRGTCVRVLHPAPEVLDVGV